MQSLLERIKAGTLWDFHGGIHPPENKDQSSLTPVVDAGLPPQLIIPVRQHAGPAGDLLVRVGDKVKKGQPLTRHDKGRFVPVHASTSGTITAIGHHTVAHPPVSTISASPSPRMAKMPGASVRAAATTGIWARRAA